MKVSLELEEARLHALKDDKGASAAVSAIMGKAKLHGLLIDKGELTGKDGAPLQTITRIELVAPGHDDSTD